MKKSENGFSGVEVLVAIVLVGLIVAVGWLVYDRQKTEPKNNETTSSQTNTNNSEKTPTETDKKTVDGIAYTLPAGWKNVKQPTEPYETGDEHYLISPDYKKGEQGQLKITSGAFIYFKELEWTGIDSKTTVEQAVDVIKNGEGGYLDTNSVKATTINGKQAVIFNSGHTTDGVSVFYKTANGKWLDASFSTVSGNDASYNAQESTHYKVFLSWLDEFVTLNP